MQTETSIAPKKLSKQTNEIETKPQSRWMLDLADSPEQMAQLNEILDEANRDHTIGGKVTLKALLKVLLPKYKPSDLDKMRELSMTDDDIVKKFVNEYNEKHGTKLSQVAILAKIAKKQLN